VRAITTVRSGNIWSCWQQSKFNYNWILVTATACRKKGVRPRRIRLILHSVEQDCKCGRKRLWPIWDMPVIHAY